MRASCPEWNTDFLAQLFLCHPRCRLACHGPILSTSDNVVFAAFLTTFTSPIFPALIPDDVQLSCRHELMPQAQPPVCHGSASDRSQIQRAGQPRVPPPCFLPLTSRLESNTAVYFLRAVAISDHRVHQQRIC